MANVEQRGQKANSELSPILDADILEPEKEKIAVATPRQLMWWKFRKHRVAVFSGILLIIFYTIALFADFISPYDPNAFDAKHKFVPPMYVSFINEDGNFTLRPGVHGLILHKNPETLRITYEKDKSVWYPVHFFVRERPYKLLGFIETDIHLFGLGEEAGSDKIFVLGSDRLGRDMLSRIFYGARISLSIGLVSVFLSLTLGIVLGGISGYYGGWTDNIIQRVIEFIRSVPGLPLWMALSAALPSDWSQIRRYFGITIILSMIGWTELGRQVRGRFLALRTEDFVLSARLSGARDLRIILRHMVPSFTSHIIASLTLSVPGIILTETGLSFLGLGLRQPVVSWGVLLQEAQNIRTVALAPWLLLPGLAVVLTVLAFNFLGDGLRDAADPFSR
ncbi:MAG: ABC transporter permease [Anaerolineae bacterium]|nr:ABC transporter permease [Anaerolineae bacterium]